MVRCPYYNFKLYKEVLLSIFFERGVVIKPGHFSQWVSEERQKKQLQTPSLSGSLQDGGFDHLDFQVAPYLEL